MVEVQVEVQRQVHHSEKMLQRLQQFVFLKKKRKGNSQTVCSEKGKRSVGEMLLPEVKCEWKNNKKNVRRKQK